MHETVNMHDVDLFGRVLGVKSAMYVQLPCCYTETVNVRGLDVFGHVLSTKKQYDCVCPSCQRSLAAARFAPHLEKCMGMGASVTRIPRRSRYNSLTLALTLASSRADIHCYIPSALLFE